MQLKLAVSCLLGGWLLFSSSAPANIGHDRSSTNVATPPAAEPDDALQSPGGEELKGSISPDDNPADETPRKPTALERAKAALAESDAPVLSEHEICTTLVKVAQANQLPVGFFANLIWRESRFDHVAISRAGAMGIAQFMPAVADELRLDAFDARDALPASGRLLRTLRARFGNLGLVAAAYNAGPKRVSDWLEQRSGLPQETRTYVNLITGHSAELWRNVKAKAVVFNVPRQVPCHRNAEFSEVEQAERMQQARKVAEEKRRVEEERRRVEKAREALRRKKKKKKPAGSITASRARAG
jgi:hypothetical protein